MSLKKAGLFLIGLLVATHSFSALEVNDEAYNLEMVKAAFKKADENKDKKLTSADTKAWATYAAFDTDGSGDVSEDELLAQVEKLYPQLDARVHRNIVYTTAPGELLLLDIYYPLEARFEKPPVFCYTHGGGWQSGTKEPSQRDIKAVFDELLKQGVACVAVKYRMVKTWRAEDPVLIRDCIVDCKDALRFLKKNEEQVGLNMDNVVVFGQSAGGHIAQLLTWSGADTFKGDKALAAYDVQPVAGVSWFGPSDFRHADLFIPAEGVKKEYSADHWANRVTKSQHVYEDTDKKTLALLKEVSPVVYLTSDSAPLLHIHGDVDSVIPAKHAHLLAEKAKEMNLPITVEIAKGAWHGWGNGNSTPPPATLRKMTTDYVLEQMKVQ